VEIVASSKASTVEEYLNELPAERREVVSKVRDVILENLPEGYQENMNWGMIAYEVPLERYPETYNKQPLMYMALAAQKNHYAVYASGVYMDPLGESWVQSEFEKAGKKLDMGKSCIRFKKLEALPLEVVGKITGAHEVDDFIQTYEKSRKK
jgi:uncharacterized protein YdhG (YjbR/CyaY superfamily)